jgi:hypothetical protein
MTMRSSLFLAGFLVFTNAAATPWSAPNFARLFSDPSPAVRAKAACDFHGDYFTTKELVFVTKLAALLSDKSPEVRGCAGSAFKLVNPREITPEYKKLMLDTAIPGLVKVLGDALVRDAHRVTAGYALSHMSLEGANEKRSPLLCELYRRSNDARTRQLVIEVLTGASYPPPLPATNELLKEAVQSSDLRVRDTIVGFWAREPKPLPKGIVPFLLTLLDAKPEPQYIAIQALGNGGDEAKAAVPKIAALCLHPAPGAEPSRDGLVAGAMTPFDEVRYMAVQTLGRLGVVDDRVLECMLLVVATKDRPMFSATPRLALGGFGPKAKKILPQLKQLIGAMSDREKKEWEWVLKKIEP